MWLPYRWLVHLNKGHFHFEPPKDDPAEYARWEYEEGQKIWERFFGDKIKIEGKSVLDLGCGPGGKTCYLATLKPEKIFGVDVMPNVIGMSEHAKYLLPPPDDRSRLEFICIDASDLPFPENYFDVITCSDSFEHFSSPKLVLSEMARVLKPGGVIAIDFAQWGAYNGHHLGNFIKTPWAHIFWPEDDVARAVREIASMESSRLEDDNSRKQLDELLERRLDQFHHGLNHISIKRFEHFLREIRDLRKKWLRRTSANPVLWPLIFIPGLRELASARNVYILEKKFKGAG